MKATITIHALGVLDVQRVNVVDGCVALVAHGVLPTVEMDHGWDVDATGTPRLWDVYVTSDGYHDGGPVGRPCDTSADVRGMRDGHAMTDDEIRDAVATVAAAFAAEV